MITTVEHVKNEIVSIISRGIGQTGTKLKSEQEIADALGIPKYRVRQALVELKRQGVLVRRGRAGTYIRKAPGGNGENEPPAGKSGLDPLAIIEFDQKSMQANGWMKRSAKLNLSLWSDLEYISAATQMELSGIIKQVQESGHRLTVHSIVREKDQPLPLNILKAQLHEHLYDGYIVTNAWADHFQSAFEGLAAPVVFVHSAFPEIIHEPIVYMDVYEAIRRAIGKFAEGGLTKIAYLGYAPYLQHHSDALTTYKEAMSHIGSEYRMESHTRSLCISDAKAAMLRLLDAEDRPQAVYVSDNFLMPGVAEALKERGVVPGRDIAIITLGAKRIDLPSGYVWSVLQFDHELLGRTAAEMLIRMLTKSSLPPCNLGLAAQWIEGQTHTLKR